MRKACLHTVQVYFEAPTKLFFHFFYLSTVHKLAHLNRFQKIITPTHFTYFVCMQIISIISLHRMIGSQIRTFLPLIWQPGFQPQQSRFAIKITVQQTSLLVHQNDFKPPTASYTQLMTRAAAKRVKSVRKYIHQAHYECNCLRYKHKNPEHSISVTYDV